MRKTWSVWRGGQRGRTHGYRRPGAVAGAKHGEGGGGECHALAVGDVLDRLDSDERGLPAKEAFRRLAEAGPNVLHRAPRWVALKLLVRQFWTPLTGVLLLAAVFAAVLGDHADAWVILAIVLLNAAFGFFLEYRAGNAIRSLASLHPALAAVLRDGDRCAVAARELVPGDVVLLEAGDAVPADCRLLDTVGLQCVEGVLTGEAAPVQKDAAGVLSAEIPLADRCNMVFAGTQVAAGRARAVVVATGMDTEVGRIAHLLESTPEEYSPGLMEVGELSRMLLWGAGGLVLLIFGAGWARGQTDLTGALWTGVSLAVAALPEGLQTVLIAALAFGAHRLALQKAVVRRLGALETLGCVNVVCTDKTGTLTEGRMSVATILTAAGDLAEVASAGSVGGCPGGSASGPKAQGAVGGEPPRKVLSEVARRRVSEALAGACTGESRPGQEPTDWSADPTENALLRAARSILPEAARTQPMLLGWIQREIPFDPVRRRRTNLRRTADGRSGVYVTGAPEKIVELCTREWIPEGTRPMDSERRRWWLCENVRLAQNSLRVLASAYRSFEGDGGVLEQELEADLILVGLVGLRDAVRPDAVLALNRAEALGVRVVMLTGDQEATALAVAQELGLGGASGSAASGTVLEGWSREELAARVEGLSLFARVAPGDKLRVVEAWKHRGAVVAMIGDGINDAPALQAADVGVAMGASGAHMAREAGDLVLLDDRLGTLMEAVAQGRRVRVSVGRSLEYLLTGNVGEVLLIGLGMLFLGISALTPLQLLWINLVTDGLPALLLALPAAGLAVAGDVREPPVAKLISPRFWLRVLLFGGCAAACAGMAYARGSTLGGALVGNAYAFGAVVFEELLRSVVMGVEARAGIRGGWAPMWGLVLTAFVGGGVQLVLMRAQWAAPRFGAAVLSWGQIGEAALFGAVAVLLGRGLVWLGEQLWRVGARLAAEK
jgi:Ca2+-transporting ATPase